MHPHKMGQTRDSPFPFIIHGYFGEIIQNFPLSNPIFNIHIPNQEKVYAWIEPECSHLLRRVNPVID